jgi:hypothetical protein
MVGEGVGVGDSMLLVRTTLPIVTCRAVCCVALAPAHVCARVLMLLCVWHVACARARRAGLACNERLRPVLVTACLAGSCSLMQQMLFRNFVQRQRVVCSMLAWAARSA